MARYLHEHHNFNPTKRQFCRRISEWGFQNYKLDERRAISGSLPRDSHKEELEARLLSGKRLDNAKIKRWRKREEIANGEPQTSLEGSLGIIDKASNIKESGYLALSNIEIYEESGTVEVMSQWKEGLGTKSLWEGQTFNPWTVFDDDVRSPPLTGLIETSTLEICKEIPDFDMSVPDAEEGKQECNLTDIAGGGGIVDFGKAPRRQRVFKSDSQPLSFPLSDYEKEGSRHEEVARLYEYEDAESERAYSVKSEALDDQDVQPVTFEANEAGSRARILRRKAPWRRRRLIIKDPPGSIDELDEGLGGFEELDPRKVVVSGEDRGSEDWQASSKEMPYYRISSAWPESSLDGSLPGSRPPFVGTSQSGNAASHTPGPLSREDQSSELEIVSNNPEVPRTWSQSSSMTDSTLLEDTTDWEEDSEAEMCIRQLNLGDYGHFAEEVEGESTLFDTLEPMKKQMVDRLMEEFWTIFIQNWPNGARQRPGAPGNSPSTSTPVSGSEILSRLLFGGGYGELQHGDKGDNGPPDDDPEKGTGEPSKLPESLPNTDQPIGFACPYRKHNPRRYCVRDWRSCALIPLKTVARVKGHLYRYHTIHQCQRCKTLFKTDEELDSHIETSETCDAIIAPPVDGITRKMKTLLQCKRKAFPGQTEAQRWKQVYQILFPGDGEVPDPYFEPVRDSEDDGPFAPNLTHLSNYEQFLRRNLPRLVRSALEAEVNNEIQPIEERLRGQLPDVIENALSRASLEYHAMVDENRSTEPLVDSGYASNHSRSGSSQNSKGKERARDSPADPSALSSANSNSAPESSGALLFPAIETTLGPDFESTAHVQQSFADMPSPEHLQFQEMIPVEYLPSEGIFSGNPSRFHGQSGGPISNEMDFDFCHWDFPLQGDSSSSYAI